MPSRRAAGYEFTMMVLPVLFWGCIGPDRVGFVFGFPIVAPPFPIAVLAGGADNLRHHDHPGVQQLNRRLDVLNSMLL
jgi:hypothetical protein